MPAVRIGAGSRPLGVVLDGRELARVPVNFGDLVDRADVRMIERRHGARLFEQLRGGQLW